MPVGVGSCREGALLRRAETPLPTPCTPREALRGGISKVNVHQVCQRLTTITHKMAPRTGQSGAGLTPRRAFCGAPQTLKPYQAKTSGMSTLSGHTSPARAVESGGVREGLLEGHSIQ